MLVRIADRGEPAGPPEARPDAESGRTLLVRAVPEVIDPASIRVRHARIADMRAVEPLIRAFAAENLMLPRSLDQLARNFREFMVATDAEGDVVGCGALRVYTEGLAEICSLAVDRPYQAHGVGRRLVEALIEEARALELKTVFALTLKPEFFGKLGFRIVPKEEFPLKVWADCRSCPKLHACDEIAVALDC